MRERKVLEARGRAVGIKRAKARETRAAVTGGRDGGDGACNNGHNESGNNKERGGMKAARGFGVGSRGAEWVRGTVALHFAYEGSLRWHETKADERQVGGARAVCPFGKCAQQFVHDGWCTRDPCSAKRKPHSAPKTAPPPKVCKKQAGTPPPSSRTAWRQAQRLHVAQTECKPPAHVSATCTRGGDPFGHHDGAVTFRAEDERLPGGCTQITRAEKIMASTTTNALYTITRVNFFATL